MKWGTELLLAILCLIVFLFIGRQLRKEPFADLPTPEIYDIQLFFKNYPFSEICEVWMQSQQKLYQTFQIDEKGSSLPQDVIQQKVTTFLKKEIPTGPLPCPFELPTSNDLDVVYAYVMKLKDTVFEQAHRTLLFCAVQTQKELTNSKKSLQTKKSVEGFITECTPEELQLRNTVPLQCIDPAVMKATEKEILVKDADQPRKRKLKKEIAIKLSKIQNSYEKYLADSKNSWATSLASAEKNLGAVNSFLEILEKEKEKNAEKIQQVSEQKINLTDTIQTARFMISFLNMSPQKILEVNTKNLAEIKQIQSDIQSGKISFT